jgi:hypothetical protein
MVLARCQKCMTAGCKDDIHRTNSCPHGHTGESLSNASEVEILREAIAHHRAYIYHARDRWPSNGGHDAVQVTSGDVELWKVADLE